MNPPEPVRTRRTARIAEGNHVRIVQSPDDLRCRPFTTARVRHCEVLRPAEFDAVSSRAHGLLLAGLEFAFSQSYRPTPVDLGHKSPGAFHNSTVRSVHTQHRQAVSASIETNSNCDSLCDVLLPLRIVLRTDRSDHALGSGAVGRCFGDTRSIGHLNRAESPAMLRKSKISLILGGLNGARQTFSDCREISRQSLMICFIRRFSLRAREK